MSKLMLLLSATVTLAFAIPAAQAMPHPAILAVFRHRQLLWRPAVAVLAFIAGHMAAVSGTVITAPP